MSSQQRRYRQYAESTDAQIDGDRQTVLNLLLQHARGYDNRVSAKELAEFTEINDSTVRDVIIELREEFSVPVANVGSGYFIVETPGELERVVEYYNGEITTKQERKQTIVRCFNGVRYE